MVADRDAVLHRSRRALADVGLDPATSENTHLHLGDLKSVISELVAADRREGADCIWTVAALDLVGTQHALHSAALARTGAVGDMDAGHVATTEFLEPLRAFRGAHASVLVVTAIAGTVAVQAPTDVHQELVTACAGGGDRAEWRHVLQRWARRTTVNRVEAELQACGVPALALLTHAVRPLRLGRSRGNGRVRRAGDAGDLPLRGIRVIELGGLWSAPLATRLLGQLGAEVVKVEAPMRPDGARNGPPAHFAALNVGKRYMSLDLRRGSERCELLALLDTNTVVIENFTGRVLPNLGLSPQTILAAGAALVRLPALRLRPDYRGLGSVIELAAGLGRPGCAPIPFTDALAGAHAALQAVAALERNDDRLRVVGQLEDVAGRVLLSLWR